MMTVGFKTFSGNERDHFYFHNLWHHDFKSAVSKASPWSEFTVIQYNNTNPSIHLHWLMYTVHRLHYSSIGWLYALYNLSSRLAMTATAYNNSNNSIDVPSFMKLFCVKYVWIPISRCVFQAFKPCDKPLNTCIYSCNQDCSPSPCPCSLMEGPPPYCIRFHSCQPVCCLDCILK